MKPEIEKAIHEIFDIYKKRNFMHAFTLESISDIFEIGNEVFMKYHSEEYEKLSLRPKSEAPDLFDDEPFSFDRSFKIYEQLKDKHEEINPDLIKSVFEINSKIAWQNYRDRYKEYLLSIYEEHPTDEFINYLTAIILYDNREFEKALKCINMAGVENNSSASLTHLKGLCLLQCGEFEAARTFFYQALFLIELYQDVPPRKKGRKNLYPNYPIEFNTSAELIRADLRNLNTIESAYKYDILPLFGL